MCKACSMLITKSNKVYWKTGVDSHDELLKLYKDPDLDTDAKPLKFAKIEISPKDGNYLKPQKSNWQFKVDEEVRPEFILPLQEKLCWQAWAKWKKEVYPKMDLEGMKNPINPIKIKHSTKVSKKEIKLASEWASVRVSVGDSVRASVWASVGDSVRASVGASVRASVGASVWASVGDSVGASVRDSVRDSVRVSVGNYIGSLFKLPRIEWKYTEKIKTEDYPFQPAVDLWKRGLVPSFDGKKWRLHQMCNKAKVIWECNKKDLIKTLNQS